MQIERAVCVVTGGANGIGRAMEGDEPFLILPHPQVGDSFRRKADDYDAWITKTAERVARLRSTM